MAATPHQSNLWLGLQPIGVSAAVLAGLFYGPWVLKDDVSVRNQAVFRGVIGAFLTIPLALTSSSLFNFVFEVFDRNRQDDVQSLLVALGRDLLILPLATVLASFSLLLAPEILGALAGFIIWRLVRALSK